MAPGENEFDTPARASDSEGAGSGQVIHIPNKFPGETMFWVQGLLFQNHCAQWGEQR